jgi:hypothetical protein
MSTAKMSRVTCRGLNVEYYMSRVKKLPKNTILRSGITASPGCGLTQLVKVPTRGNNILDWCLVNKPKLFDEPVQLPNIGSSDHFSILINPSAPNSVIRERHVYKREMKDS